MKDRPISHLRAEFEHLATEYDRARRHLQTMQERLQASSSTAKSDDGLVSVTVGPRGNLTKLEIHARAYKRLSPSELAESIVKTADKAVGQAVAEFQELLKPFVTTDVPLEKLLRGEVDMMQHLRVSMRGISHSDTSIPEWGSA